MNINKIYLLILAEKNCRRKQIKKLLDKSWKLLNKCRAFDSVWCSHVVYNIYLFIAVYYTDSSLIRELRDNKIIEKIIKAYFIVTYLELQCFFLANILTKQPKRSKVLTYYTKKHSYAPLGCHFVPLSLLTVLTLACPKLHLVYFLIKLES